jgi:hypothetical protein
MKTPEGKSPEVTANFVDNGLYQLSIADGSERTDQCGFGAPLHRDAIQLRCDPESELHYGRF